MSWASLLLLRRSGTVWAVSTAAVLGLEKSRCGARVQTAASTLHADEVLGVARGLVVRSPGRLIRRFWADPVAGVAVHEGAPVIVVDPRRPPRALIEEESGHANA